MVGMGSLKILLLTFYLSVSFLGNQYERACPQLKHFCLKAKLSHWSNEALPYSTHWLFIARNCTGDLNFRSLTSESIETETHQSAPVGLVLALTGLLISKQTPQFFSVSMVNN